MANYRNIWASICLLFISFVLTKCEKEYRNVTTEYLTPTSAVEAFTNGSCNNLVHSTSVGPRDSLHYVYSSTGRPSLLVARTGRDAKLMLNWTDFVSTNTTRQDKSISFDSEVFSSAILSFDEIYVFNDTGDTALMDKGSNFTRMDVRDILWRMSEPDLSNRNLVSFVGTAREAREDNKTQIVTIEFLASSGHEESTADLPHLLLNSNLTEINVQLTNIENDLVQPRVALGLTLFADRRSFLPAALVEEKSLNDELSPGAFRTINWLSNDKDGRSHSGAFVQWKPICYLDQAERNIHNMTRVTAYGLRQLNQSDDPHISLATGFYGRRGLESNVWTSSLNVSFGITGDRFYSKTNFVTWQLTFGLGSHPQGSVSILIILVIAVGLGIPVIVMVAGAIYLPIRSRLLRRKGYEELSGSYPRIG